MGPTAYLLEQVAHLDLHFFNHAARVRDVRRLLLQREVLLRLARHAPAQCDLALTLRIARAVPLAVPSTARRSVGGLVLRTGRAVNHLQHDRGGELVVRLPPALGCLEDVDGVPGAGGLARGGRGEDYGDKG